VFEPREEPVQPIQARQFAVRDGDAIANAGGAEALSFHQGRENRPLRLAGDLGGAARKILQRLLLAGRAQLGDNRLRCQQIRDFHDGLRPLRPAALGGVDPDNFAIPMTNDIWDAVSDAERQHRSICETCPRARFGHG
jgi:hypothetical protein